MTWNRISYRLGYHGSSAYLEPARGPEAQRAHRHADVEPLQRTTGSKIGKSVPDTI